MIENSKLIYELSLLIKTQPEPIKAWLEALIIRSKTEMPPSTIIKTRIIARPKPIEYAAQGSYNFKRATMRLRSLLKTRGFSLQVSGDPGARLITVYKL